MSLPAEHKPQDADQDGWVVGWKLDPDQRRELLMQFPPVYAQPVADHVTLASRVGADAPLPSGTTGEIVGRVDDGAGVEALVVQIDGTAERPGGGTFHITWSLGLGRTARESNEALASGWTALEMPMPVLLVPACWPRRAG